MLRIGSRFERKSIKNIALQLVAFVLKFVSATHQFNLTPSNTFNKLADLQAVPHDFFPQTTLTVVKILFLETHTMEFFELMKALSGQHSLQKTFQSAAIRYFSCSDRTGLA